MTATDREVPPALVSSEQHKLRGNMSTFKVLFTVLAFNGPILAIVAFLPVVVGYGNGVGAPVVYLLAGSIIGLFAIGFIKMSRHVDNPGGFYSYVTKGLGRELGLGAALLAIVGYGMVYVGSYPLEGGFFQAALRDTLGGPDVPLEIWVFGLLLVVSIFGYFNLELSARVLAVCMALEVIAIVIYNAVVVGKGGAAGLSLSSFDPDNVMSGSVGIGLLFAMLMFTGFEATVIFRDEVREPEKTIPRAAFGFIIVIGLTYGLSVWSLIQAIGAQDAAATTAADPTGSVLVTMEQFVGKTFVDIVMVLLCTSGFAAALALHNVLSRYLFNLGVDGIVWRRLGVPHPRHGSPHLASAVLSVLAGSGLIVLFATSPDPLFAYAQLSGGFGYAFQVLLLVTVIAIMVFLVRTKPADTTLWHRAVAPLLAMVGLAITLWLASTNFSLLVTGDGWVVAGMFVVIFGSLVVGVVWARVLKQLRPEIYAKIGRQ